MPMNKKEIDKLKWFKILMVRSTQMVDQPPENKTAHLERYNLPKIIVQHIVNALYQLHLVDEYKKITPKVKRLLSFVDEELLGPWGIDKAQLWDPNKELVDAFTELENWDNLSKSQAVQAHNTSYRTVIAFLTVAPYFNGWTTFYAAADYGYTDIIQDMFDAPNESTYQHPQLHKPKLLMSPHFCHEAAMIAIDKGHLETLRFLITIRGISTTHALSQALISKKNKAMVEELLGCPQSNIHEKHPLFDMTMIELATHVDQSKGNTEMMDIVNRHIADRAAAKERAKATAKLVTAYFDSKLVETQNKNAPASEKLMSDPVHSRPDAVMN